MRCSSALLVGLLLAAPPLEEVNRAVRDVLADESVQSSFPGGRPAEAPRAPPPPSPPPRGEPIPLVTVLLWGLVGVCVLLAVLWLARNLGGYSAEVAVAPPAHPATPRAPPLEAALEDAAALAGQARYAEAVHALLLVALASLGRRAALPGSWTSREILREAPVSAAAREAVRGIVEAVEVSLFGGRDLGRADYEASVERYRIFAAAADAPA